MKRIIILSLFCLSNSGTFAMQQKIVGTSLALSPAAIPATYYYLKNKHEGGRGKDNIFKGYMGGLFCGCIPPLNTISLIGLSLISIQKVGIWVEDDNRSDDKLIFSKKDRAHFVGLLTGCSLYATIPLTIMAIKKNPTLFTGTTREALRKFSIK